VQACEKRETIEETMMKKYFLLILLCVAKLSFSQNINFIIQVNDQLLTNGEIQNLYIKFDAEKNEKYYVNYFPGDLIIDEKVLAKINSTDSKFYLHFDYTTYRKENQQIANFEIELNKNILNQPYVIANVFDFRNRKYKNWYQRLTKENYLVQLTFPGSGLYIRSE